MPTGPGPDARARDVAGVTAELVLSVGGPALRQSRGAGRTPSTSPPGSTARLACRFPGTPTRATLHVPLPPAVPRRSAHDGPVSYHRAWPAPRQQRTALPQPWPPALTARPARAASAPTGLAENAWPRGDECLSARSEPGRGSATGMVSAHGPVPTWLSESAMTTSRMKALARRAFPSPSRLHATLAAPAPGCLVLDIQQSCRIGRHDRYERQRIHRRSAHPCSRGEGKTGRRVVRRAQARGLPVRVGSRPGEPPLG